MKQQRMFFKLCQRQQHCGVSLLSEQMWNVQKGPRCLHLPIFFYKIWHQNAFGIQPFSLSLVPVALRCVFGCFFDGCSRGTEWGESSCKAGVLFEWADWSRVTPCKAPVANYLAIGQSWPAIGRSGVRTWILVSQNFVERGVSLIQAS